jgi:hypothetical protein
MEDVLRRAGASGGVLAELLEYCENPYALSGAGMPVALPLPDEPHVAAWLGYEEDARRVGAFVALRRRFAQLQFPIRTGMSDDDGYRRATRRGMFPESESVDGGLALSDPSGIELAVCPSMAGRVPVITVRDRGDFVALVQAFTERNEPNPVPSSMGACAVTGLNNWHRIALYRAAWEEAQGGAGEAAWAQEFQTLIPRKDRYQDRFIILSHGPYSAVPAGDVNLPRDEWLARSLVIRREHEFLHYFTYRLFNRIRSNVFDELIADFVGIVAAFGTYSSELALRLLGVAGPSLPPREARIRIYRGTLSDAAFAIVCGLAARASENLEQLARANGSLMTEVATQARVAHALATLSLPGLASRDLREIAAVE